MKRIVIHLTDEQLDLLRGRASLIQNQTAQIVSINERGTHDPTRATCDRAFSSLVRALLDADNWHEVEEPAGVVDPQYWANVVEIPGE